MVPRISSDIAKWQRERLRNFHQQFTTKESPAVNLVDDEWTRAPGMVAIAGNEAGPKSMEELPVYMSRLHELDLPRQNRVRARVQQIVKDRSVTEKLQPWYPTWCKRPCFHDECLSAFNMPNVTLVDTEGKGIERLTSDSLVAGGQTFDVDIIIFATGFRNPFVGSPAEKANMVITGRNGVSMSESWAVNGPSTLHGVLNRNFPNLFLSGPFQASMSPCIPFGVDVLAQHAAHILFASARRAEISEGQANGARTFPAFAIEPTVAAAEDWAMQILIRGAPMAAGAGCTPGFYNVEGIVDRLPSEEQLKMARSGVWGYGIESYLAHIEAWRAEGGMRGIEMRV